MEVTLTSTSLYVTIFYSLDVKTYVLIQSFNTPCLFSLLNIVTIKDKKKNCVIEFLFHTQTFLL
jgi:hypothetical protein